jgi:HEAT repeat protein
MAETSGPGVDGFSALAQADTTTLVSQLVDKIRQRYPAQAPLCRQLLEACAFMPPGTQFVVDDLLPLCDFAGLDLDAVAGRTNLETLLGQCVRYGLLRFDPYAARYTLGHSTILEALQCLAYPDASARWQVVRQRYLAAAILRYVQQGERVALAELAPHIEEEYGAAAGEILTPVVVVPFRRLLPTCTQEERQRMANALGGFGSALAVELLRCLVHDEDGQVRSGAVQSLADLAREETLPVLLEALRDSNSDVRWIATQALGQISGSTAVDALIPMLTDEDKEVGRIAAEGLGRQGDSRAVPHLMAAMRESYPLLRESAVLALGQLADQRALPALQEVLQDANQQVRRSAEVALARFSASSAG